MQKINYRELSNWVLAKDFYHTWREIFIYIKNNSNEFYIWHNFFNMNLELKCVDVEKHMCPKLKTVGIISKDFDEHIKNIKFKRNMKNNNPSSYFNTPSFIIKHSIKKYISFDYGHYTKPSITNIDEIDIPNFSYYSKIDDYVNILEQLFNKINLKDKKKIYKCLKRWENKKDKWSAISFWKRINEAFNIDFILYHSLDNKLKDVKLRTTYQGKLCIDTKEHYHMRDKCEKWAIAKRKEDVEKKREENSNI